MKEVVIIDVIKCVPIHAQDSVIMLEIVQTVAQEVVQICVLVLVKLLIAVIIVIIFVLVIVIFQTVEMIVAFGVTIGAMIIVKVIVLVMVVVDLIFSHIFDIIMRFLKTMRFENMVFNETYLLRQLQYALGSKLFNCFDQEYFIDILKMKTLVLYSTYYPKLIRGVRITKDCAIPTIDPKTGMTNYYRYKIPKFDPEDEYIGIERWIFNGQGYEQAAAGMGGIAADAIYSKIRSMLPIPPVRWRATFEAPDFCEVFPYRVNHDDFVLVMQRLVRLTEIPSGLWESFTELFIADVKLAIYNEFPAARNSGVLNGVEIDTNISEFSNAESKRDEIKTLWDKDWKTNADRFEALNIAGFA